MSGVGGDAEIPWIENAAERGALLPWRELWQARELVVFFASRDLKVRYKQAVLGVTWVVLQPIVTVAALTLVFDRLADVDSQGMPYPVFALAGLLGWTYISACISRGSEVLVGNPSLITKVWFPRIMAPIASLLPPLVDLAVGLVLLMLLMIVYGVLPSAALLMIPLWLLFLALTALGPVLFLAAINVRYRDARQVVAPLLQAMLFLSPVAYTAQALDGAARLVYSLNPAVGVLELGRWVLASGDWPGVLLIPSTAVAVLLTTAGLLYFQRASRHFADVI